MLWQTILFSRETYSSCLPDESIALVPDALLQKFQQTSNVTYRIYDFNRKDKNGNTRELHTELSKDAIDYTVEEDYRTSYTPEQNKPIELVTCPYFTTSVYDLTENMTMDYSELDSFVIYICMEGSCTVTDNEGHSLEIQAGESILFPRYH